MIKFLLILILISSPAWATNYCLDASARACILMDEKKFPVRDIVSGTNCSNPGYASSPFLSGGGKVNFPGKFGSAVTTYRSGVNDNGRMTCGGISDPTFAEFPITLMAWFKPTSGGVSWTGYSLLFGTDAYHTSANKYAGAWIRFTATTTVEIGYGDNGGADTTNDRRVKTASSVGSANVWHHYAAVLRSATDMTIYVDAVDVGGSYTGAGSDMVTGINDFGIGCTQFGVGGINGDLIDEIGVFTREMNQDEIVEIMNNGLTGNKYNIHGVNSGILNSGILN